MRRNPTRIQPQQRVMRFQFFLMIKSIIKNAGMRAYTTLFRRRQHTMPQMISRIFEATSCFFFSSVSESEYSSTVNNAQNAVNMESFTGIKENSAITGLKAKKQKLPAISQGLYFLRTIKCRTQLNAKAQMHICNTEYITKPLRPETCSKDRQISHIKVCKGG